jgi:hypothetical protein
VGGFRDPNEALRARAESLEARLEEQERALREKDAEIARLKAADPHARDPKDRAAESRAERARKRNASRASRRATQAADAPSPPPGPPWRADALPAPSRWAIVRASLAVALGSVALAGFPFGWVLTQPVQAGDGWSGVLFAAAFFAAVCGVVQLPAVCFGFLATGAEGVVTDGENGETRTTDTPCRVRGERFVGSACGASWSSFAAR